MTCVIDGKTISGETDPFVVPPNGVVNVPPVHFGQTTPIPTALTLTATPGSLTQAGATKQLLVTAIYPDGTTQDVTAGSDHAFERRDRGGFQHAVMRDRAVVVATERVITHAVRYICTATAHSSATVGISFTPR